MKYYIEVIICELSLDNLKQIRRRRRINLESSEMLTTGEVKSLIRKELNIINYIKDDIIFDDVEIRLTDSDISKNDIIYEIII